MDPIILDLRNDPEANALSVIRGGDQAEMQVVKMLLRVIDVHTMSLTPGSVQHAIYSALLLELTNFVSYGEVE